MFKRMLGLFAVVFALFGTKCWAQGTTTCFGPENTTTTNTTTTVLVVSCTNSFMPGTTTGIYDFTGTGDGKFIVDFQTVKKQFFLTSTVNPFKDPISTSEFPPGTVAVTYANGHKDEYDFSGTGSGKNGVPVKGEEISGEIEVEVAYDTFQTIHTPAFCHAPGDNATAVCDQNIITGYSCFPPVTSCGPDPTMDGIPPGLSSFAALDEPLTETDTYCWVSPPSDGQTYTVGESIEVSFQLFSSGGCLNNSGTPIRDKTASLSLSKMDTNGDAVFPPRLEKEEGDKFHWEHGVNESDLSTEGLQPGSYTITVISSKFSPQSRNINLAPSTGMVCLPLSGGVCFD